MDCGEEGAKAPSFCLEIMGRWRSQDPQNRYKVLLNPFK